MPDPREHVATRTTRLGALASPPFARFLSGQVVSQVGTKMSNTAGAWILYRLTHSPLALGLQGLCFSAPIAVLPLATGILADRFSRLTLVKATLGLGLSMFSAAGRGALTIGIAFACASAGMAAFAVGPPFVLAFLLLAGASLCLAVTQVIAGAMIQQAIPDGLRGRISALGSAGQNGLAGLGAVATSGLAATVGPGRAIIGLAGTIACAGIFLALLIARASRRRPALPVRPARPPGPPTLAPGAHAALKGHQPDDLPGGGGVLRGAAARQGTRLRQARL